MNFVSVDCIEIMDDVLKKFWKGRDFEILGFEFNESNWMKILILQELKFEI